MAAGRIILYLALLIFITACEDRQQPSDLEDTDNLLAADNQTATSRYDCDNGLTLQARYEPRADQLVLFMTDRAVRMEHVPSASGAKFSADNIVFWSKDGVVLLQREGRPDVQCQ